MKQKILELIDRKIEYYQDQPIYDYGSRAGAFTLAELRSEIEKIDEWIPVNKGYPYDNTHVLVSDGDFVDIAQGFASEYSGDWIWNCSKKWTHWQPLPLSPNN